MIGPLLRSNKNNSYLLVFKNAWSIIALKICTVFFAYKFKQVFQDSIEPLVFQKVASPLLSKKRGEGVLSDVTQFAGDETFQENFSTQDVRLRTGPLGKLAHFLFALSQPA
jgi:hypothetical protein